MTPGGLTPAGSPARPLTCRSSEGPDGVNTGGIYKSTDGGDTWSRINSLNERPFYFSVVRVDPTDEKIIYSLGINFKRDTDGGKTFDAKGINTGLHSDHHDLWINPKDGRHMIVGTGGGFYITYDRARPLGAPQQLRPGAVLPHLRRQSPALSRLRRPPGQRRSGRTVADPATERTSNPDYLFINGGDGFVCRVDPFDPDLVYAESQDGNLMRAIPTAAASSSAPRLNRAGASIASTGTRRSSCRSTTRTCSTVPATTCSARSSKATT